MSSNLPVKKAVSFQWHGTRLEFDVAQDVFSSFQVDRGSRLLLDSLDMGAFSESGQAADFGCGYGVLGIAWQTQFPDWTMQYVDRDALAVALSRHNTLKSPSVMAEKAGFVCDISLPVENPGYDLVLWNVPGKAGRDVIAGLAATVIDGLAPGGLLAIVIVHPLADIFTEELERSDASTVHMERGKEHTVVHVRREQGKVIRHHPFDDGLFDRPSASFAAGSLEWTLTPVVGLPEYDSLNHATELAAGATIAHSKENDPRRWLVFDPGVGHLAVVASRLWPEASGAVHGRDALAMRATRRALPDNCDVRVEAVWGIDQVGGPTVDLLVMALPEQAPADELASVLATAQALLSAGGTAIFHGRSTEVARLERALRKSRGWRARKPEKLRGSAAIVAINQI